MSCVTKTRHYRKTFMTYITSNIQSRRWTEKRKTHTPNNSYPKFGTLKFLETLNMCHLMEIWSSGAYHHHQHPDDYRGRQWLTKVQSGFQNVQRGSPLLVHDTFKVLNDELPGFDEKYGSPRFGQQTHKIFHYKLVQSTTMTFRVFTQIFGHI